MAKKYLGLSKGGQEIDITTGSSVLSKDVEVVVDQTNALQQWEVVNCLEKLLEKIKQKASTVIT